MVKRCAKNSWLTHTKDYVTAIKQRKMNLFFYFADAFIILDLGISFRLTIHFYLLMKQRYQICNSFSFVISLPPPQHPSCYTLYTYFNKNKILSPNQFGFKEKSQMQFKNFLMKWLKILTTKKQPVPCF